MWYLYIFSSRLETNFITDYCCAVAVAVSAFKVFTLTPTVYYKVTVLCQKSQSTRQLFIFCQKN